VNAVSSAVVFILAWWTVLFAVLPWGSRPPDAAELGHEPGAPARPRLVLKFAVTTLLAAAIWAAVFVLVELDVFSFRDWARTL
jgi:predicted secreted protein